MGVHVVKLIAVREETHRKLMELKFELRVSSIDKVINILLEHYYSEGRKEVKRSEEEIARIASDLIKKVCKNLGEEARFLPLFIVKRYKIQDKDIVDYFEKMGDKEIDCSEVLKNS